MSELPAPDQAPPPAPSEPQPPVQSARPAKKRRGCCCCCLFLVLFPLLLLAGFAVFSYWYMGREHPVYREWKSIPEYSESRTAGRGLP